MASGGTTNTRPTGPLVNTASPAQTAEVNHQLHRTLPPAKARCPLKRARTTQSVSTPSSSSMRPNPT